MKNQYINLKHILSEKLTLYPFLLGILFLLNELRKNGIFYTIQENVLLTLIVSAFVIFIYFLTNKIIKNKTKAALISASFIFINLYYQDIVLMIFSKYSSTLLIHPEIFTIPLILFVWLFFSFLVLKSKFTIKGLNFYLNVVFILFIFAEITQWIITPIDRITPVNNKPFPVESKLLRNQKPDIYYIVLDSYTSSGSLSKYWKYNNSDFEDSLRQLGFYIDDKCTSDFTETHYCISSYLNSSPLLLGKHKKYNERNLSQIIRNNRLYNWLLSNDYHCYNYSLFDAFGEKKDYTFFTYNHFLGRTIWYTNIIKIYHYLIPSSRISQTNLNVFEKTQKLSEQRIDNPIFVYSHIMMPHSPFSFGRDGKQVNASVLLTDKQKYLDQLIYTNSLTIDAVKHIIKCSKSKPIIIIQGDHGFRLLSDTTQIEKNREAHTIFYAVYTPNGIVEPNNIKPINTFQKLIEQINHRQIYFY